MSADRLRRDPAIGFSLKDVARCLHRDTATQELQRLFEKGLISRQEYDDKRATILKEL